MMVGMLRRAAPLILLGALLSQAGCSSNSEAGEVVTYGPDERVEAPLISGELLDGSGTWQLSDHLGQVIVINFWASWCAPCRVEADDLERVHQAMPEVRFVGINTNDDKDAALAFAEGRSTYPSIFDKPGRISLEFDDVPPIAIPATLIIDSEGRIAAVIRKAILEDDLRDLIDQASAPGQA